MILASGYYLIGREDGGLEPTVVRLHADRRERRGFRLTGHKDSVRLAVCALSSDGWWWRRLVISGGVPEHLDAAPSVRRWEEP